MSLRARLHAGDPDAFRRLFDEQATAVYNHAYRLLGDWSAAEDVVSLTFLEAWRLRGRIDCAGTVERSSLRPWLLGIATNVVRNVRRADRRHRGALSRVPRAPEVPDLADEVAAHVDDRPLGAQLSAALAQLRRPDREVLALSAWAVLPPDVAAVLWQALALLSGVTQEPAAVTFRGHSALAATWVDQGWQSVRFYVDPDTHAYVGSETTAIADYTFETPTGPLTEKAGSALWSDERLAAGIVDKPGDTV